MRLNPQTHGLEREREGEGGGETLQVLELFSIRPSVRPPVYIVWVIGLAL